MSFAIVNINTSVAIYGLHLQLALEVRVVLGTILPLSVLTFKKITKYTLTQKIHKTLLKTFIFTKAQCYHLISKL